MAKAFKDYTVEDIADRILDKNPNLREVVVNNPGQSYKALQEHISTRLCMSIGRDIGQFVKRNDLTWAIVNRVEGKQQASAVEW